MKEISIVVVFLLLGVFIPNCYGNMKHLDQFRRHFGQNIGGGGGNALTTPCPFHPKPIPLPTPLPPLLSNTLNIIEVLIEEIMKKANSSAISAAITYDGKPIWQKDFSLSINGKPAPAVNQDTPFRIGSLSKVFTDVMLMQARDAGYVALDDPIAKYWPDFSIQSRVPNSQGITFREIATQLSGLPSGSPCQYFPACNITTEEGFQTISNSFISVHESDVLPHYSDLGYVVIGRALEKPTATTWEDWVTENIINKLGLNNTGWEFIPEVTAQMPPGFLGPIPVAPALAFDDMLWARPTGGMYSTSNDLLKFIAMFINATNYQPNPAVNIASLREMLLPSYVNDDQVTAFGFPFEWYFVSSSKTWSITKGGFFPGYTASLAMVPKLKYGNIVLNNNVIAVEVSYLISDIFLPELIRYLKANEPQPVNPGNLTAYAGIYFPSNAPINYPINYTMTVSGNSLNMTAVYNGEPVAAATVLNWYSGNTFQIQLGAGVTCSASEISTAGEYVVFQTFPGDSTSVASFSWLESDPYFGVIFERDTTNTI